MAMRINRHFPPRKVYVLGFLILIFLYFYFQRGSASLLDRQTILKNIDNSIKSQTNYACKQPNLPVYAPEIMKYIKHVPPIDCSEAPKDWVTCKDSECRISPDIIIQKGPIQCTFTDILRKNEFSFIDGDSVTSDSYYKLENSDTVRVKCASSEEKWESILTSVRIDKNIWDRTGWQFVNDDGLKLNVLIFALDSLSRNTVIRKLPETYKYLKETLQTIVLEGYNIIGDGTPQALTPMLTGKTELELPSTSKKSRKAHYVDIYPMIWNDFRKNGYITGYLEDCPTIGTYTYRLKGFLKPPTDHYMRTYYMSANKMIPKWLHLCAGSRPRHQIMLDFVKDYFSVYKSKPKFMFAFHAELSHDDYNLIGAADEDIKKFLKHLHQSGALNNTMMIFMADHGHRFAEIRDTMQGKMEERLPFFSFTFPPWFKNKYKTAYDNFKSNAHTLVTPFDIHATLQSVLSLGNIGEANMTERSLSLFSKISKDRSCAQAYIEPHWCACLDWNSVKLSMPIVQELGDAFVKTLNNYTKNYRNKCAILRVSAIYWVSKLTANENLMKFKKNYDYDGFVPDLTGHTEVSRDIYQIKMMLSPGDSLFEVTMTHYLKENRFDINMDDISRINMYGTQARCIEHTYPHLRKYCYCITD